MTLYLWSQTAASNGTIDVNVPCAEGWSPAQVNNSMRGLMSVIAKYRDDVAGSIVTGGSVNAYTVTSFQVFDTLADMNGKEVAFSPSATNTGACTLNVDGLGVKALRPSPNVDFLGGELILGTPYMATYNNSDGAWYVKGYVSSPFAVPFLGAIEYWDTVAPNSAFIFPQGQTISRTTYAKLFAKWGTKYGAGDGSTTFGVPDCTGRVRAMIEASASRLTSSYFGGDSTQLGSVGGGESKTLITANLPPYTPAGTNSTSLTSQNTTYGVNASSSAQGGGVTLGFASSPSFGQMTVNAQTFTGTAQGGTSTPLRTVQPTITCNYIIRIL